MQKMKIPITLDPVRVAQKRSSYDGIVPLRDLSRLTEQLQSDAGDVEVVVDCGTDEQGLVFLQGEARAELQVTCQRCGEPMTLPVNCSFAYTPVKEGADDSDLEDIPERYDVIERNEFGEINLRMLVEDELILALPLFPMHEAGLCNPEQVQMSWGEIEPEPEKPNPFAILQELKKK